MIERNHRMVARILPGTARQTALEAMADLYRTLPEDAAARWLESGRQALASQTGDAMPAISPKRKNRAAPFKTSALESARRAGIARVFAGPPDLAANRKKYLKEKLRGKAGTAR